MSGIKGKSGVYNRTKLHGERISISKMGHSTSEETKRKISVAHKGKKLTNKHKESLSKSHMGKKSSKASHWLGDKVGKIGIHIWLRREFGTPQMCESCLRSDKKWYDWACKDHKYTRDRNNYMRLCRSCHRKYDMKNNGYRLGFNQLLK